MSNRVSNMHLIIYYLNLKGNTNPKFKDIYRAQKPALDYWDSLLPEPLKRSDWDKYILGDKPNGALVITSWLYNDSLLSGNICSMVKRGTILKQGNKYHYRYYIPENIKARLDCVSQKLIVA